MFTSARDGLLRACDVRISNNRIVVQQFQQQQRGNNNNNRNGDDTQQQHNSHHYHQPAKARHKQSLQPQPNQQKQLYYEPLHHNTATCDIKLLRDNNYIITCTMDGGVFLWDRRALKTVHTYSHSQNSNNNNSGRSIVHCTTDPYERLLFAGM